MKSLLAATQQTKKNTEPQAYITSFLFRVVTASLPMAANHNLSFNFYFQNAGSEDGADLIEDAKIYLGKPDNPKEEMRLKGEFEKWWRHPAEHPHRTAKRYAAKDDSAYFSSDAPSLTTEDMQQIQSRALTFYMFVRITYSDHSGHWEYDQCSWLQNPLEDLAIAHACLVGNHPRHRAKQLVHASP